MLFPFVGSACHLKLSARRKSAQCLARRSLWHDHRCLIPDWINIREREISAHERETFLIIMIAYFRHAWPATDVEMAYSPFSGVRLMGWKPRWMDGWRCMPINRNASRPSARPSLRAFASRVSAFSKWQWESTLRFKTSAGVVECRLQLKIKTQQSTSAWSKNWNSSRVVFKFAGAMALDYRPTSIWNWDSLLCEIHKLWPIAYVF